jgi:hypothetical protein
MFILGPEEFPEALHKDKMNGFEDSMARMNRIKCIQI